MPVGQHCSLIISKQKDQEGSLKSYAFRDGEEQHGVWLTRAQLKAGGRDEKWLQALLFARPELVPLDEIIAGTRGYVSVCRELTIPKAGGKAF